MNKKKICKRFLLYFVVMMFLFALGCGSGGGGSDDDHSSDNTNISNDDTDNDNTDNDDVARGEFPIGTWVNDSEGISFTITSCGPCSNVDLDCEPNWEYCYGNIKYENHTVNLPGNQKITELLLVNMHNHWMHLGGDEDELGSWTAGITCHDDYATDEATCLVIMADEEFSFSDYLTFIRQ